MLDVIAGGRPAGDILSRVVRITLGGQQFVLPVRSIRANRDWKAALDERTAGVVNALVEAGDDNGAILQQLATNIDPFIELLVSYAPSVLSHELIEGIEPDASMDVIAACQEVWLAATPLLATGLEALSSTIDPTAIAGSTPTSSSQPSTAGAPKRSSGASPTSSSSATSIPRQSGSPAAARPSSRTGSSRPARARSSPTTSGSSHAGTGTAGATTPGASGSQARRSSRPS